MKKKIERRKFFKTFTFGALALGFIKNPFSLKKIIKDSRKVEVTLNKSAVKRNS